MDRLAGNTIVTKVLDCLIIDDDHMKFRNYEEWEIQVKTYLMGQDLWDVVKPTAKGLKIKRLNKKIWRKKDKTALHAIQISCGYGAFSLIKNLTSAKKAWATLQRKYTEERQYWSEQNNKDRIQELESQGNYP